MRRAAEPDRKQRRAGTRRERRGAGGGGGRCGSGSSGDCGEATQPGRRVWCRNSSLRPWVVAADAGRGGNNDSAGALGRGGEGVCEKGLECLGSGRKISKLVSHMLLVDFCFFFFFLMADSEDTPRLPSRISLGSCQLIRSLK